MTGRSLLLVGFVIMSNFLLSQVQAITEFGDTIYVYDNGTWSFEVLDEMPVIENQFSFLEEEINLDTINEEFTIPDGSNKEISHPSGMFSVKYNSFKWERVPPATLNDEADYAFKSKVSDIWSVIIHEETEISKDKLLLIAKNTMKKRIGENPLMVKSELRKVNGTELIRGAMRADFSNLVFIFDTYYYSSEKGSVQYVTWTTEGVWEQKQKEILDMLNGFIVL